MSRRPNRVDQLIATVDGGLRTLLAARAASEPSPAAGSPEGELSPTEKTASIRLMRVNRAGEVAAQALYRGQALTARSAVTRRHLQQAAAEETDHLTWCTERLAELGGRPSQLDPLWYLGSVAIGGLAGLAGDKTSLGFVAETERQVEAHLADHIERLPPADERSRAILTRMLDDESRHGREAEQAGGRQIPEPVRSLMGLGGRILRQSALYL
jgi:ubiquinone biosynthesis monooxygenase Coq7